MNAQTAVTQDERVLAGLAHGSVLLGPLTNGVGGIVAALVIWLVQREKSVYVARQALQALVYQLASFVVIMLGWCCWFALWMAMWVPAMIADPAAYTEVPPAGLWVGMILMVVPLAVWGLFIIYGLWAAAQAFRGRDFSYAIVGHWLRSQK